MDPAAHANPPDGRAPQSSARKSWLLLLSSAAMGALVTVGAVLPAEFYRDPLGIGKATGIDRLWASEEVRVTGQASAAANHSYATPFRSDVVDVPLKAGGDPDRGDELEYKVRLKQGASYIYSWEVAGLSNPAEFYSEFHGHTTVAGKTMTVADYRKATGGRDNGVLVAPFDGVHGWYFQNQSLQPVTVKLHLAGFYDLIPDGEAGNEAGLHARPVTIE